MAETKNQGLAGKASQTSGVDGTAVYDKGHGSYQCNLPTPPTKSVKYHGQTTPFSLGGK